jgi:MFS family permease
LAKQAGYPASSIGFIYSILPIVGLIAKPLCGFLADIFKIQKKLFILFQFVIVVAFFGIIFVPSIPTQTEFHCHNGVTLMKICPSNFDNIGECTMEKVVNEKNNLTSSSQLKCEKNDAFSKVCHFWNVPSLCEETGENKVVIDVQVSPSKIEKLDKCFYITFYNATVNQANTSLYCPNDLPKLTMQCEANFKDEILNNAFVGATDEQVKSTSQFWIFFMLLVISWAGMAVVVSVGDTICFELLGDKPNKFGYQRFWGSVGWGILSIVSGLMIDAFSSGPVSKNYSIGFYLMAVFIFFDMIVSAKLNYTQTKHSSNILRDVIEILMSIRVIVSFFRIDMLK